MTKDPLGPLSRRHLAAAAAVGLLAAACTTSPEKKAADAATDDATSAAPTPTPSPTPAVVEIVPADRATDVLPNTPVTVTASVGKVRTVKVTDDQGKELAGSIDAAGNWTSSRFMKPSATYTVEVSAEGPDGTPSTQQAQFTTLKPGVTATYGINYSGMTVGVGMPVAIQFDTAVQTKEMRAQVERLATVTTEPAVEGSWGWLDNRQLMWRPKDFWVPGTKVTVSAPLAGVQTGDTKWVGKDESGGFTIGDAMISHVDVPGQITAPAHTLYEIVRKLPDGADVSLSFSGDDPRLVIQAGRSRFNLPVLPAGDFPVMSSDGLSSRIAVDTNELIRLIDKTRFAISTEETRYYLNGLYVHTVNEGGETKLRAVATDGHRLALAEMPAPEGAVGLPGVIVPRKTIAEARRLMESAGETVDLQVSPQKVRFEFGQAALTSKVIDGAFPDYLRVIPRDNAKILTLDNDLFAKAVDRVATISAEKSRSVKLAIEPGRITLTVRNMEAGQAVEEVEVDYDGEPFEIGFNARYLLDVCGQIAGPQAEFRFADPASPTLVVDPVDPGVKYVLMPLRV